MLRSISVLLGLTFVLPLAAQDERKPDEKKNYAEFSKIVHGMVVKQLPKTFEDASGWGQTIPVPPNLRLPRLRTYVKVGDHLEVPHGLWRKAKFWFDDPQRDLQIEITELKKVDDKYRVTIETVASMLGEGEAMHWQKGLPTIQLTAMVKATVQIGLDCDVAITFDTSKFPPDVKVEPKVVQSRLDLKELELFRPENGDRARELNGDIRGLLQTVIKNFEPHVTEEANKAIAKALREGKGTFSADKLLGK